MQIISRSQEQLAIRGQPDITGLATCWNFAWRAFCIWRERKRARAALAKMTDRELADIGMTTSDRAMALADQNWADPDSNRNIKIVSHRMASDRVTHGTCAAPAFIRIRQRGNQHDHDC